MKLEMFEESTKPNVSWEPSNQLASYKLGYLVISSLQK